MRLEVHGVQGEEGVEECLSICLSWAPQRDDLGAFSRFCMLLLKASYCISFCLSLPTCKMGPIPPTSLESPGSRTRPGRALFHALLLSGVRLSGASLPHPSIHPVQDAAWQGWLRTFSCSLTVPHFCCRYLSSAWSHVPK